MGTEPTWHTTSIGVVVAPMVVVISDVVEVCGSVVRVVDPVVDAAIASKKGKRYCRTGCSNSRAI